MGQSYKDMILLTTIIVFLGIGSSNLLSDDLQYLPSLLPEAFAATPEILYDQSTTMTTNTVQIVFSEKIYTTTNNPLDYASCFTINDQIPTTKTELPKEAGKIKITLELKISIEADSEPFVTYFATDCPNGISSLVDFDSGVNKIEDKMFTIRDGITPTLISGNIVSTDLVVLTFDERVTESGSVEPADFNFFGHKSNYQPYIIAFNSDSTISLTFPENSFDDNDTKDISVAYTQSDGNIQDLNENNLKNFSDIPGKITGTLSPEILAIDVAYNTLRVKEKLYLDNIKDCDILKTDEQNKIICNENKAIEIYDGIVSPSLGIAGELVIAVSDNTGKTIDSATLYDLAKLGIDRIPGDYSKTKTILDKLAQGPITTRVIRTAINSYIIDEARADEKYNDKIEIARRVLKDLDGIFTNAGIGANAHGVNLLKETVGLENKKINNIESKRVSLLGVATGENSVAIGTGASSSKKDSFAIGSNAISTIDYEIMLGGNTGRIINNLNTTFNSETFFNKVSNCQLSPWGLLYTDNKGKLLCSPVFTLNDQLGNTNVISSIRSNILDLEANRPEHIGLDIGNRIHTTNINRHAIPLNIDPVHNNEETLLEHNSALEPFVTSVLEFFNAKITEYKNTITNYSTNLTTFLVIAITHSKISALDSQPLMYANDSIYNYTYRDINNPGQTLEEVIKANPTIDDGIRLNIVQYENQVDPAILDSDEKIILSLLLRPTERAEKLITSLEATRSIINNANSENPELQSFKDRFSNIATPITTVTQADNFLYTLSLRLLTTSMDEDKINNDKEFGYQRFFFTVFVKNYLDGTIDKLYEQSVELSLDESKSTSLYNDVLQRGTGFITKSEMKVPFNTNNAEDAKGYIQYIFDEFYDSEGNVDISIVDDLGKFNDIDRETQIKLIDFNIDYLQMLEGKFRNYYSLEGLDLEAEYLEKLYSLDDHSQAFGHDTIASGMDSVAFGYFTTASGYGSAAFSSYTTAQPHSSFVIGRYNEISGTAGNWIDTDPLFVIGNGADAANPNNAVTVLKNGNVGIGTTSPSKKLYVNGDAGGTGGWNDPSSQKWKTDITPLNNTLEKVTQIQGITYNWRVDEFPEMSFEDSTQIGIIAEELEKVFPELVNTDQNGDKSIEYGKLTPILIEAIKEQQNEIDEQQEINESQQLVLEELKTVICPEHPELTACK